MWKILPEIPHLELVASLQSETWHHSVLKNLNMTPSQIHVARSVREIIPQNSGANFTHVARKYTPQQVAPMIVTAIAILRASSCSGEYWKFSLYTKSTPFDCQPISMTVCQYLFPGQTSIIILFVQYSQSSPAYSITPSTTTPPLKSAVSPSPSLMNFCTKMFVFMSAS